MFITGIQNTPTASTPNTSTMPWCLCLSSSQQLQQTRESHEALSRWVLSLPSRNRTVETLYVQMHAVTDYRCLSGRPHLPCLPIPIENFNSLQNWNKKNENWTELDCKTCFIFAKFKCFECWDLLPCGNISASHIIWGHNTQKRCSTSNSILLC